MGPVHAEAVGVPEVQEPVRAEESNLMLRDITESQASLGHVQMG